MRASDPHRHRWSTDEARTSRICDLCGTRQRKVSGRWQLDEQFESEQLAARVILGELTFDEAVRGLLGEGGRA